MTGPKEIVGISQKTKDCGTCGQLIPKGATQYAWHKNARVGYQHCSRDCLSDAKRRGWAICAVCGKEFKLRSKKQLAGGAKFCTLHNKV